MLTQLGISASGGPNCFATSEPNGANEDCVEMRVADSLWNDLSCTNPRNFVCERISCIPNCTGKVCGDDGCGGSCGTCDDANDCTTNVCDAGQASCSYPTLPDDTACAADANECTQDICQSGTCAHPPEER